MKRSIVLRLSAMFGIVSLLVFTLVGCGLFVMMERQLFAELRATLDTRTKVAEMIVSHRPRPCAGVSCRKSSPTSNRPTARRTTVDSPNPDFRFGTPVDGVPVGAPFGAFQRYALNHSTYDVMTKTVMVAGNGERPTLKLTVASSCERTQRMLRRFGWTLAGLITIATIITLLLSRAVARFSRAARPAVAGRLGDQPRESPPAAADRRAAARAARPRHVVQRCARPHPANLRAARGVQRGRRARAAHAGQHPDRPDPGRADQPRPHGRADGADAAVEPRGIRAAARDHQRHAVPVAQRRGERATDLKDVSLADEVRRMLDFLEIPLDEAQLRAELHGDARAAVDPSLFRRAMTNLLINAIQHSAPGATVSVTIVRRDTLVEMSVANPGEPIDPPALARIRALLPARGSAREQQGEPRPGLSIVKAVAEMHGGSVFVACSGGINTFGFSVSTKPCAGGLLPRPTGTRPGRRTRRARCTDGGRASRRPPRFRPALDCRERRPGRIRVRFAACSRHARGDIANRSRNTRLKCDMSLNPQRNAMSDTRSIAHCGFARSCAHRSSRRFNT